jgi:flagellar assembly factor FliW
MTMTAPAEITRDTAADIAITFADGLVGCQDWKQFVLLTDDGDEHLPVALLQSLDNPEVSLMVTDPRFVDPAYSAALTSEDIADLDLAENALPVVYCTLSTGDGWLTANLLGPLVVNPSNRRAKQIVQIDSTYTTKHPVVRLGEDA